MGACSLKIGDKDQRQTAWAKHRRRSCSGRFGPRANLTQVVDFHDNFSKFQFVFGSCGADLIATAPPRPKARKTLLNARRCGVSIAGRPCWRARSSDRMTGWPGSEQQQGRQSDLIAPTQTKIEILAPPHPNLLPPWRRNSRQTLFDLGMIVRLVQSVVFPNRCGQFTLSISGEGRGEGFHRT